MSPTSPGADRPTDTAPSPTPPVLPVALRLGTRASRLALAQSGLVARDIERVAATRGTPVRVELVRVTTHGDTTAAPLRALGGVGVFVARLRQAVLSGECDVAVHSAKDLPVAPAPGLTCAAVPLREDVRDVLCARGGLDLAGLPAGARVGTGSPRRAAQLVAMRPDLHIVDLRGNVPTRLAHVGDDLDAVVLAAAGLRRLGLTGSITQYLDPSDMVPAAAQGALAVEVRSDADPALVDLVAALDHAPSRLAITAERALMRALGVGCAAPVGALALVGPGGTLTLRASVSPADGGPALRRSLSALLPTDEGGPASRRCAEALGEALAGDLVHAGAEDLVDLHADATARLPGEERP